jgi:hypothetical protein
MGARKNKTVMKNSVLVRRSRGGGERKCESYHEPECVGLALGLPRAPRGQNKIIGQDFAQNEFGFYPIDTANLKISEF